MIAECISKTGFNEGRIKEYHIYEKDEMMRNFSPLEFLAELSTQIPRVFEQTTRYFGVYSPRARGKKRREERFQKILQNNFEPVDSLLPTRPPSQSWARCMKLVFEVDPPLPQMRLDDED